MLGVVGYKVGQVTPFGVVPKMFHRVKFRGVSRQPLHMQPTRLPLLELAADRPRKWVFTIGAGTIPPTAQL
jgi:hypothetical protein